MSVYVRLIIHGSLNLRFVREVVKELFLKMELVNAQKDPDGTPLLNNVYN